MSALEDAFRTIAYDVRGHGRTGGSDVSLYSIDLFASDLEALLGALGIERAVVCGLSMGGAIAQSFAATYPERVAGLVLVDTFPTGPMPTTLRLAMANIRFLARLDRLVGYQTLNRWQLRIGDRLLPGISGDQTTVQGLVEDGPTIPHAEFVKIADATARFPRTELEFAGLSAPTLVLHGEHLPMANESLTDRLVEQLAHTDPTVLVVPESGHASNVDNPEYFTSALRTFLTERVYDDAVENVDPDRELESP